MTSKTKMIMAVFAVAMMVAVSLVPLTYSPVDGLKTETATEEQSVTFESVIESLKDLYDDVTFANAGFTLVPVTDAATNDPIEPEPNIKGVKEYTESGSVVLFKGTHTFGDNASSANNGKITIGSGVTIKFCPVPTETGDLGFTITDNNVITGASDLIVLKSGAMISICGLTFKVLCHADAEVPVISMVKGTTAVFHSEKLANGTYKFGYDVNEGTGWKKMTLFGMIDNSAGTSISVQGNYTVSTDDTFTASFTDCVIDFNWVNGRFTTEGHTGTGDKSTFTVAATPSATGCDIDLSVDLKFATLDYTKEGSDIHTSEGFELKFDNMKISTSFNATDNTVTTGIGWNGTNKKIVVSANEFHGYVNVSLITVDFKMKGFEWTITEPTMTLVERYVSTDAKPVKETVSLTSSTSIVLKSEEFSVDVGIMFFGIEINKMLNPELSINNLSTTFDATTKKFSTTAGAFGITGTIEPKLASMYNVNLNASITDLLLKFDETAVELTFTANGDMSVNYNGEAKHLIVTFTTFTTDFDTTQIAGFSVSNNIPLSKVLGCEQDMIGHVTANGLAYSDNGEIVTITGTSLDAECNTIVDGICDVVTLKTGAFTLEMKATETLTEFWLTSNSFTGYIKNVTGEKQQFSIEGTPAKIKITPNKANYSNELEIISGTATFAAGLLPFTLVVDSGVTFTANGLSANFFEFKSGSTISGSVTIDLADRLIYPVRTVTIGDQTVSMTLAADKGGYALTVNLASKVCSIATHTGWTLKEGQVSEFTFADKSLNGITNSEFSFKYSTDGSTEVHKYGDAIELKGAFGKEGKTFVGWNDGTKTYAPRTVYYMPAHSVTMTPVYADIVTPTVTSGVAEIRATDANDDAVSVSTSALENVDKAKFEIGNTTVTMDKATIEKLKANDTLTIAATVVKNIEDETTKQIVGNGYLFDIALFAGAGDDSERISTFEQGMSFEVTVNVAPGYDVKDIVINYMDENGHLSQMNEKSYVKLDDGSFDVTFTTSHFSGFVVSPVQADTPEPTPSGNDNTAIAIIALIVIIAIIGAGAYFYTKKNKN